MTIPDTATAPQAIEPARKEPDRSNTKVPLLGSDILAVMDAIDKVMIAIKGYEQPMLHGGPLPTAILDYQRGFLEKKLREAPVVGAAPPSR